MSTLGVFSRVKKLGEGTYGSVYRATAIDSGHVIAFKRMVMTNDDEGVPATAIREIALLRELKHANVVDLLHVLFEPPKITLVFELCDYDLKQYIESKNGACLDPHTEVQPILKQMLTGLSYLHSKSVVHRDLKPQNVFINIRPAYYALTDGTGTFPTVTAASLQQYTQYVAGEGPADTTSTTAAATRTGAAASATVLMSTSPAAPCRGATSTDGNHATVDDAADAVTIADGGSMLPPLQPHASLATMARTVAASKTTSLSSLLSHLSCIIVKLGDFGLARVENIPVKKYSHEAVTLWYRSPDVIMGSALYSLAVDMWSVGAIFFEMVTGKVFLAGRNEEDQLYRIFKLLGSPTRETWPSMLSYPSTIDRLRRVQTMVAEGKMSTTSSTDVTADKHASNAPGNVIAGAIGSSSGSGSNSSGATRTGASAVVDASGRHETGGRANTYNMPRELWISEGRFDDIMTTSGFRGAVGESGVDLLRCCLQYEPQHRITAAQALRHPFLRLVQTHDMGAITQQMDALAQSLQYKGL